MNEEKDELVWAKHRFTPLTSDSFRSVQRKCFTHNRLQELDDAKFHEKGLDADVVVKQGKGKWKKSQSETGDSTVKRVG
jgi:hypothetical protein